MIKLDAQDYLIGIGDTPQEAYGNLMEKKKEQKPVPKPIKPIEKTIDEVLIDLFGDKDKKLSIKEFKQVIQRLKEICFYNCEEELRFGFKEIFVGEHKAYMKIEKLLEKIGED